MENEIKIYKNLDIIKEYINQKGAKLVKNELQITYAFDNPQKSIFEGGDGILRVRVTKDNLTKKVTKNLTLKNLVKLENNIKSFDEKDVGIEDELKIFQILNIMGFEKTQEFLKKRISYYYQNCLFEFDALTTNGTTQNYLEIESEQTQNIEKILKEINHIIKED